MPSRRVITRRSQEPSVRYAEEVKALRAASGTSLRELGTILGWDPSNLGRVENGQTLGSPELAAAYDQHYGTGELLLALWELAAADPKRFKEQYQRYMKLEQQQSVSLWHYSPAAPPGLLQTPGYAREALMAGGLTGDQLEEQVEARVQRRKLLEGDGAPPLRAILSEAVLRTALADKQAWREQLEYLLEVSERPNIIIQVLPFSAGPHALMSTATMFLRLTDGRTVAYSENDVRGELIEDTARVEALQRRYDSVRDLALPPAESRKFILRVLEEVPCEPST